MVTILLSKPKGMLVEGAVVYQQMPEKDSASLLRQEKGMLEDEPGLWTCPAQLEKGSLENGPGQFLNAFQNCSKIPVEKLLKLKSSATLWSPKQLQSSFNTNSRFLRKNFKKNTQFCNNFLKATTLDSQGSSQKKKNEVLTIKSQMTDMEEHYFEISPGIFSFLNNLSLSSIVLQPRKSQLFTVGDTLSMAKEDNLEL